MAKYEIFQLGKLSPLTVIEAESWRLTADDSGKRVVFHTSDKSIVAMFNWNNIAGFREVTDES